MVYKSNWSSLSEALSIVVAAGGSSEDLRRALFDGAIKARGLVSNILIDLHAEWWTSDCCVLHDRNVVEVGSSTQPSDLSRQITGQNASSANFSGARSYRRAVEVVLDRASLLRLWPSDVNTPGTGAAGPPAFPSFRLWSSVDQFTVQQAAALWAGIDPAVVSSTFGMSDDEKSRLAARQQMLEGAVMDSKLQARSDHNAWARIGNHDKSLVSRDALIEFAKQKNERPKFLFDTLLELSDQSASLTVQHRTKNRGGRPVEYDWNGMTIEIIRIADLDGLPGKQSDLIAILLEWFQNHYGEEPAESAVKARVSSIYKALGRSQKLKGD
jgi:hypothetical protein